MPVFNLSMKKGHAIEVSDKTNASLLALKNCTDIEAIKSTIKSADSQGDDVLLMVACVRLSELIVEKQQAVKIDPVKFPNDFAAASHKEYETAIKILAVAEAIHKKHPEKFPGLDTGYFIYKMSELNKSLQADLGLPKTSSTRQLKGYRQALTAMRVQAQQDLDAARPSETLRTHVNSAMKALVVDMMSDCMAMLGPPPCEYALFCLGSLSRDEATPYSDLEYGFLIADDAQANKDYFIKLSKLFELQVCALGECHYSIGEKHSVIPGFRIDEGGNRPIGPFEDYGYINTPEKLAAYQLKEDHAIDKVVKIALWNMQCLGGNTHLVLRYDALVQAHLDRPHPRSGEPMRRNLALHYLVEGADEFELDISSDRPDDINVKSDLVRLPNFFVTYLSVIAGISGKSTTERLSALEGIGAISHDARINLESAINKGYLLRCQLQLYYGEESEKMYTNATGHLNDYLIQVPDIYAVLALQQVLTPLKNAIDEFASHRDINRIAEHSYKELGFIEQCIFAIQDNDSEKLNEIIIFLKKIDGKGLLTNHFQQAAKRAWNAQLIDEANVLAELALALNPENRNAQRLREKIGCFEPTQAAKQFLESANKDYHHRHLNAALQNAIKANRMIALMPAGSEQVNLTIECYRLLAKINLRKGNPDSARQYSNVVAQMTSNTLDANQHNAQRQSSRLQEENHTKRYRGKYHETLSRSGTHRVESQSQLGTNLTSKSRK